MEFRKLTADETEVLTGTFDDYTQTLTLLIYKTAQAVEDILDEAVGAENWYFVFEDKTYTVEEKGWGNNPSTTKNQLSMLCNIHIYNEEKDRWVVKSDIGTMPDNSQKAEDKVKSLYSDAIKRAGTVCGIGRELYSCPKIVIPIAGNVNTYKNNKGKLATSDSFSVADISYNEKGKINFLVIRNESMGRIVYTYDIRPVTDTDIKKVLDILKKNGLEETDLLKVVNTASIATTQKYILDKMASPAGIEIIKKQAKKEIPVEKPEEEKEDKQKTEEKKELPEDEDGFKIISDEVDDTGLPFK